MSRRSLIKMPQEALNAAAASATYVRSEEHKSPHIRSDATPCPPDLEGSADQLAVWLRDALRNGHIGGLVEGNFPRYVWHREGDRYFEGRLTNQELGEYKGYPIDPDEAPSELRG